MDRCRRRDCSSGRPADVLELEAFGQSRHSKRINHAAGDAALHNDITKSIRWWCVNRFHDLIWVCHFVALPVVLAPAFTQCIQMATMAAVSSLQYWSNSFR